MLNVVQHHERANALEDRHVSAEMELRQGLAQEHKACLIRLRHMEQYCNTSNTNNNDRDCFPTRKVTERDLRELSQQYDIRDDMDRMHQARINVMRDKQARQLEALEKRQQEELEDLMNRQETELDALENSFAADESEFQRSFGQRKERLTKKWAAEEETMRTRLSNETGNEFGPLPSIMWPNSYSHPSQPATAQEFSPITPPRSSPQPNSAMAAAPGTQLSVLTRACTRDGG